MTEWILIIHVVSAALLFGTGVGTAFYKLRVNQQNNVRLIAIFTKQVVFADWVFTGSAGVVQFITGIVLIYLKGYSSTAPWIMGGFTGYFIAGFCWFIVVYLQIRCRDLAFNALRDNKPLSVHYYRCYKLWWMLG